VPGRPKGARPHRDSPSDRHAHWRTPTPSARAGPGAVPSHAAAGSAGKSGRRITLVRTGRRQHGCSSRARPGRNDTARARALGGLFDSLPPSLTKSTASAAGPRQRVTFHRSVPRISGHYRGVRLCKANGDRYRANELRDRRQCPGAYGPSEMCADHPGRARTNRQTMVDGASTPAAARRTIPRAGKAGPSARSPRRDSQRCHLWR
jgi:hypothetical protein